MSTCRMRVQGVRVGSVLFQKRRGETASTSVSPLLTGPGKFSRMERPSSLGGSSAMAYAPGQAVTTSAASTFFFFFFFFFHYYYYERAWWRTKTNLCATSHLSNRSRVCFDGAKKKKERQVDNNRPATSPIISF